MWEVVRLLASGPPRVLATIKETARVAEPLSSQGTLNRVTRRELATVDILYGAEDRL